MSQSELTDSKTIVTDLLLHLRPLTPDLSEDERARRVKAKEEHEAAMAENRRIEWLNGFYQRTSNHGLPMSADDASLSALDMESADRASFEMLKAWRPDDRFGFLIVGPAGCGKSFALQALAKEIVFGNETFSRRQQDLKWFPVSGGLDRIRREMSEDHERYKRDIMKTDYLFVDDLGAENLTEWAREQIYQIFEHRLNFGLTTFVSSNCTLEELKTRYHERFVSRLKEVCVILQLKGRDRRTDVMRSHLQTLKDRIGVKA